MASEIENCFRAPLPTCREMSPGECVGTVAAARVSLEAEEWAGIILDLTLPSAIDDGTIVFA